MNILLGSHGVGKTTILKEINRLHPEIYTSDGFSRPIKNISEQLNLSQVNQQIIINELTHWGYLNYLKHNNILIGRSIIDCIVYTQEMFPELNIDYLYNTLQDTINRVNIFYIPIEFEIEDDGVRYNKELQLKIDSKIIHIMNIYNIKSISVTGSISDRVSKILKIIK